MNRFPQPSDIQQKADALIEQSSAGRKIRDHVSWVGIVIFATALVLVIHAVIDKVVLA